MQPVLVFDFDGTVCLGAGPVLAYAEEITRAADTPTLYTETRAALDEALNSATPVTIAVAEGSQSYQPRDGYDLVRRLAARRSVPESVCQEAYLRSRQRLADTEISAPAGLADFLSTTDSSAILATNAPVDGLDDVLRILGLDGAFAQVFSRVGKPDGLARLVETEYADRSVVGFGDIWDFDLAPLHAQGHRTGLMNSIFAQPPEARPTWRIDDLGQFLHREARSFLTQ